MAVSADESAFLGFVVEGIIYGMYIVLFALSLTVLLGRSRGSSINILLLSATCILFGCCTAHFALNFDNKWKGLMTQPGVVSISNEDTELFAADVLVSITDFFGQLVLIYRCWLLWGKNYAIIALPLLIACTAVACAMAGLGLLAETDPSAPFAPAAIQPLGTTSFALSLCLNIIVTALIVGRIWRLSRPSRYFRTRVHSAIEVIVESGLLYLAVQLIFVVLFAIGHPAQNIVVPAALQIYGIAPTLLILRVRMVANEESSLAKGQSNWSSNRPALVSVNTEHGMELSVVTEKRQKEDLSSGSSSPKFTRPLSYRHEDSAFAV